MHYLHLDLEGSQICFHFQQRCSTPLAAPLSAVTLCSSLVDLLLQPAGAGLHFLLLLLGFCSSSLLPCCCISSPVHNTPVMKFATQSSGLLLEFCCGCVKLRTQLGSIGVHLLFVPTGASELSLLLLRVQPSITHRLLGALMCTKHAVKPSLQW